METRQELLKMRKLLLDTGVGVCRAAESATSHKTVLDHDNRCGGKNHFKRKCLKDRSAIQRVKTRHQRRVYKVYEYDGSNDSDDSKDARVYSIAHKGSADAKCRMFVNLEPVVFQIDTGVTVNMLPARYARDMVPYKGVLAMWNKTVKQRKCQVVLNNPKNDTSYDGEFVVFRDNIDYRPVSAWVW